MPSLKIHSPHSPLLIMVKESRVTHAKISNWAKIIRNAKLEEQKKKEKEKRRKDQDKIRSWKRRASLLFIEKLKKNNMSLTQSKMDMNDVNGFLKDTKERNQSSERSDLGGDCICCYEHFTNTTHKPIAFQCGHVVCVSCAPMLKKCPTCSKVVTNMIILHV